MGQDKKIYIDKARLEARLGHRSKKQVADHIGMKDGTLRQNGGYPWRAVRKRTGLF